MSIQGSIASELTLDDGFAEWLQLAPSWEDFEAAMPLMWPEELQRLLPQEGLDLLANQKAKLDGDWKNFSGAFPDIPKRQYIYSWFLVGTRSFYYEEPAMMVYPWNDRLALLPVADLFNHGQTGCKVSFSTDGYTMAADRQYVEGEEVLMSYGTHSNDFLLVEYGFVLDDNLHDRVCLDKVVLERLNNEQQKQLKDRGLLGGYMLGRDAQMGEGLLIALRVLCLSDGEVDWQSLVDGEEDAKRSKAGADEVLSQVLLEYSTEVERNLGSIQNLELDTDHQRAILLERWKQVQAVVQGASATK